ncbi:Arabinose 5-phosphate isomerase KpsF [Peribacillus simplex]|uniref:KpsF/GutQ family sugar-phosphate isomerase n=1 Tax=Peribacillus simplex TaxID=1478 RepID=UPI001DC9C647|nr:Arabinose 5-phosphate isomerase KpsF [Peribacillus simplex]
MDKSKYWKSVLSTWVTEGEAVKELQNSVSKEEILDVIKLIGDSEGKVLVAGCGTSGAAAKKIAHSLSCIERPASYLNPADAVHGALGLLQKGDILILISKGGNTKEIVNLIPACKAKGATLVAVTENRVSILSEEADYLIKVKVKKEPDQFNMLATASTMAVIAVFDAVCIALMDYTNFTREQFAVIHPGGAVGEKLLKK